MPTVTLHDLTPPEHMLFASEAKLKDGEYRGIVDLHMPIVQLGDKDDLMTSTWGTNTNFVENKKVPLDVLVPRDAELKFREVDQYIQATFEANSRAWLKKDKTYTYKPMLKETDQGVVAKVKVVVEGTNATSIKLLTEDLKVKKEPGTLTSVNKGCQVLAYVSSNALWFNTKDCTYGVALTAKTLLVNPGADAPPPFDADAMILAAGFEFEE
jgi:hypothetical protein